MYIHSFIVVRKIFALPLYTLNMETSRTFLTVLGNFRKKRQKFLAKPIYSFFILDCVQRLTASHVSILKKNKYIFRFYFRLCSTFNFSTCKYLNKIINPFIYPSKGFLKGFMKFIQPFIYSLEGYMNFINLFKYPSKGFMNGFMKSVTYRKKGILLVDLS